MLERMIAGLSTKVQRRRSPRAHSPAREFAADYLGAMRRALSLCCCAVFLAHGIARAQATPSVPLGTLVYRDLDAMAGAGLIDDMLIGSRPYSRREVVRLLREAERNIKRLGADTMWTRRAIDVHLRRYADRPAAEIERASADLTSLSGPARLVPADSNGSIDALIEPLTAYRDGRRWRDGTTAALDARAVATLGRYVALSIEPRFGTAAERGRDATVATIALQSGSTSLLFGNFAIGLGREYAVFGQSPTGGTLLSRNAPALDAVRLSNDQPARLPWILSRLGPMRGTALLADLGPNQIYPHSRLIAYRMSAAPSPQFEFGAQFVDEMGGQGAPSAILRDRLYDVFPLIDVLQPGVDYQFSNKLAGLDFRWRMPDWRGFELFADGALDDIDPRRWKSILLEDAGYVAGVSFSCLVECGVLGVRAEYHQTGIRYYTHGQFKSGIAQNQFVLGDPLGPRGLGAYLVVDRSGPLGLVTVTGALEVRSGNRYMSAITGEHDRGFHFELIERHPGERRTRLAAAWTPAENRMFALRGAVGVERIENFAFVQGRNRTHALAQIGVEYRP